LRLKEYFPLFIVTILVLALIIVPATAELKTTQTDDGKTLISDGTYWISWDPIGDHIVGDQFFINGTTNLSNRTVIYYQFFAPTGGCHTKICNRKSAGVGEYITPTPDDSSGVNTFSIFINTTDFQSNEFVFSFSVISSDDTEVVDAFYQESYVDTIIPLFPEDLRSITEHSRTTHPDAGISYWMSVNNMEEYTRPCYQLSGTTNLPPGETLSYSFLDPIAGVQGLYRGGIVIPSEKPGINRFFIPINTSNSTNWTRLMIWNPRYNASVFMDTISTTMEFRPSPDAQNVTTTCSVTLPVTTPASPLSLMGTYGALFVCLCLLTLEKKSD
jgi:hypothetical protein